MIASRRGVRVLAAWIALSALPAFSQADAEGVTATLETIRADLRALRFEAATEAVGRLLESPDTTEDEAVEARALRAQARVATGAFESAAEDWRAILELRPAFEPERSLLPSKALARFDALRDAMVGRVRLDLAPADAVIAVDGRPVVPDAAFEVALLAGPHRVTATRRGFDPEDVELGIEAGKTVALTLQLEPNVRTVVVLTEAEGVEVRLDGRLAGTTSRRAVDEPGASRDDPARLVVEDLPLGEYRLELSKPCHRPSSRGILVTADLRDLSPLVLPVAALPEARGRVALLGAPEGALVLVDGADVGTTPLGDLDVCPGRRRVEVRRRGRSIWSSDVDVPEIGGVEVEVRPRPTLCLVGEATWPAGVIDLASSCSPCGSAIEPTTTTLDSAARWKDVELPESTDFAITMTPPSGGEARGRLVLHSPILGTVEEIPWTWTPPPRPRWLRRVAGLRLADSNTLGAAIVVEAREGGAGARTGIGPGDRIAEVAGQTVQSADDVIGALRSAPMDAPLDLVVVPPGGRSRRVTLDPPRSPAFVDPPSREGELAWTAAWASVDAASLDDPAAALANLALALSRSGNPGRAIEVWPRVVFGDRRGIGDGTVSYALGRDLAAVGRLDEAREAFKRAEASTATYPDDEGAGVALAASDRLRFLSIPGP